jgi:acyl-CoA thioester hydrolase
MEFERTYQVESDHIDVQGIMDGLYYPFYFERCRHDFLREVLGYDLESLAQQGTNVVLSQYFIRFLRSLRKDDIIVVGCDACPDTLNESVFHLKQEMRRAKKLVSTALFTATFVQSSGGRSFIPQDLLIKLGEKPAITVPALPME